MKRLLTCCLCLGLGLTGCINDSQGPASFQNASHGSAQIRIPVFPSVVAASKSGAADTVIDPAPSVDAAFEVTIIGPGMAPITRVYPAARYSGQIVEIDSIPSGPSRTFTGFILEGGAVTHQGSATVYLAGNKVTPVTLVLRNLSTGNAEICILVDDWANSNSCDSVDTVPPPPRRFNGYWLLHAGTDSLPIKSQADTTSVGMSLYSLDWQMRLSVTGDQATGNLLIGDMQEYDISGYTFNGVWRLTVRRYVYNSGADTTPCFPEASQVTCLAPPQPLRETEMYFVRIDSPLFDASGSTLAFKGWTTGPSWLDIQSPIVGKPLREIPIELGPRAYDTTYSISTRSNPATANPK